LNPRGARRRRLATIWLNRCSWRQWARAAGIRVDGLGVQGARATAATNAPMRSAKSSSLRCKELACAAKNK
jgi:hypothetical protein